MSVYIPTKASEKTKKKKTETHILGSAPILLVLAAVEEIREPGGLKSEER